MDYLDAIFLGLIQGLTEFLPISSSGHLVIAEYVLKAKMPGVMFELLVHLGTLFSVVIYFRRRLGELIVSLFRPAMTAERREIIYLVLAVLPAVLVAVLFQETIENAFHSPRLTSLMLLVTGLFLLATGLVRKTDRPLGPFRAIIIGVGQALAILPGISRSGATISAGIFAGVNPTRAAEFSFLLSIPTIAGAIVFKFGDILSVDTGLLGPYLVGLIAAFFSGLLAVYILLAIVRRGKFAWFGIYCLIIGFLGIFYFG